MCRAIFSRFRSFPHSRPVPQPRFSPNLLSFSRFTGLAYQEELEPGEEKIAVATEQVLESVRTRAITLQNAVQQIISLAKNKSEDERVMISMYVWKTSFKAARISADSTIIIANFLSELSCQSQEHHDDWYDSSIPGPVMIENDFGYKERLWHDMPGLWDEIHNLRTDPYVPNRAVAAGIDRTDPAGIDRFLKDRRFISTLFLSASPAFQGLSSELLVPFQIVASWPPRCTGHREEWHIWIPAIVVQLNIAGAKLKDTVLSGEPCDGDWPALGWWLRWQRRLLAMAADETIDAELRGSVKQAYDMMTIERHLTNHWWRRWRHELLEIAANEGRDKDERVTAKVTHNILAMENARMR